VLRCLLLKTHTAGMEERWPVPRVLGLQTTASTGWALLEDVPGIGAYVPSTVADARLLAQEIVALQAWLAQAEQAAGITLDCHPLLANLARLRKLCRKADDPGLNRAELLTRVHTLRERLGALPLCLSHNDIGPGNMAIQQVADLPHAIRFIDFGTTAHNVVGADLHHYAAWAHDSPRQARFFDALAHHYATLIQQPEPLVRAGAQAYALERLVMRWWRRKERRCLQARTRLFLARIQLLLQSAEANLAQAPQG